MKALHVWSSVVRLKIPLKNQDNAAFSDLYVPLHLPQIRFERSSILAPCLAIPKLECSPTDEQDKNAWRYRRNQSDWLSAHNYLAL
jgi:hypothetical protein